jgi:hypothetical protein
MFVLRKAVTFVNQKLIWLRKNVLFANNLAEFGDEGFVSASCFLNLSLHHMFQVGR